MLALLLAPAWAQDLPAPAVVVPPEAPRALIAAPAGHRARFVPFRVVLVPGFGLGAHPDANVQGVSLGMWSMADSLEGFDAELVGSWVDGHVAGIQASVAANVAGEVDGAQLATGVNWARGDAAVQLAAGINVAEGDVNGVQGSAGINIAGGDVQGVQATAGVNVAKSIHGLQGTAGVNVADEVQGLQAAPLNVAADVEGAQVGIVNVGGSVEGVQLGIVNVAKHSDVSIGLLNFIGDGLHRVDVWASESAIGTAGVKFGSRHVYTLLGAGWVGPDQPYWTYGGGFGVHLPARPLWVEVDGSVWAIADGGYVLPGLHNKLRAQVGLDIAPHFAPFAGVSMNLWTGYGDVLPRAVGIPSTHNQDEKMVWWPGFHAGVSF
jgi:hypothetical protein